MPRPIPKTIVEVTCEGCVAQGERERTITFRMKEEHRAPDGGHFYHSRYCRRCSHNIEVFVYPGGGVQVYQSGRFNENRHSTSYRVTWQERMR